MKKSIIMFICLIFAFACSEKKQNEFLFAEGEFQTNIYIDNDEDELVKWAVEDFLEDLEIMSGKKFTIEYVEDFGELQKGIYIGTISESIGESISERFTNELTNQWENFIIEHNHAKIIYPLRLDKTGKHILRIYVNQTGIVLDQIAVTPFGAPDYYEILR